MSITCNPYVTIGSDGFGVGYRAICTRHGWRSQVWLTRAEAVRSGAAHKRAKRQKKSEV